MEEFLQVIKEYGAAIIGTLSVGGVATIGAVIVKIYKAFNDTKSKMQDVLKKKEESEEKLAERYAELQTTIADQNKKLDTLTEEVSRVKGNRTNK